MNSPQVAIKKIKLGSWSKLFQSEYSLLQLKNGVVFLFVYLFSLVMVFYHLWILVDLVSYYVFTLTPLRHQAALEVTFRESFYDYLIGNSLDAMVLVMVACILVFFLGIFLTRVLIRPFEQLAGCCLERLQLKGNDQSLMPSEMIRLGGALGVMSDIFFTHHVLCPTKSTSTAITLPSSMSKIDGPRTNYILLSRLLLPLLLMVMISSAAILILNQQLSDHLLAFVLKYASINNQSSLRLLQYQSQLLYSMSLPLVLLSIILNCLLAQYLCAQVSHVGFALFSTLRSFLKGNLGARMHVIGHQVFREHTRSVNRYLDALALQLSEKIKSPKAGR